MRKACLAVTTGRYGATEMPLVSRRRRLWWLEVVPSPRPAGRLLRETWPSATAATEVRRGEASHAPAGGEGENGSGVIGT
jgi:hypothetical protein